MEEKIIPSKKCPICGNPTISTYKPFCSKKCADIDLGRWLKGSYIMHTDEAPTDDEYVQSMQNLTAES